MTPDVQPADVPLRELEARWGLSRNGLKARARALGVELVRLSSTATVWPGQYLELGERLHEHLSAGQPMATFPGLKPADTDGTEAAMPAPTALAKVPAGELAALATAITEAAVAAVPSVPPDPLQRARGLAEAADAGLILTSADLGGLLGQGVTAWRDGHEAYGYRFRRHQQGRQVLWAVERAISASSRAALPAGQNGQRRVGFAPADVVEARVTVLSPAAQLFARNVIG